MGNWNEGFPKSWCYPNSWIKFISWKIPKQLMIIGSEEATSGNVPTNVKISSTSQTTGFRFSAKQQKEFKHAPEVAGIGVSKAIQTLSLVVVWKIPNRYFQNRLPKCWKILKPTFLHQLRPRSAPSRHCICKTNHGWQIRHAMSCLEITMRAHT